MRDGIKLDLEKVGGLSLDALESELRLAAVFLTRETGPAIDYMRWWEPKNMSTFEKFSLWVLNSVQNELFFYAQHQRRMSSNERKVELNYICEDLFIQLARVEVELIRLNKDKLNPTGASLVMNQDHSRNIVNSVFGVEGYDLSNKSSASKRSAVIRSHALGLKGNTGFFSSVFRNNGLTAMLPKRLVPITRRRFFKVSILMFFSVCGIYATKFTLAKYEITYKDVEQMIDSSKLWLEIHLFQPLRAMIEEIVGANNLHVADIAAAKDAEESLSRMLRSFADYKGISSTAVHDMSIVSRAYEAEISKPLKNAISGDLIQLMLIQVQFLKRELLSAMVALDSILITNRFNTQLVTTVPVILLATAGMYIQKQFWFWLVDDSTSRSTLRTDCRMLLSMMERSLERLSDSSDDVLENLFNSPTTNDTLGVRHRMLAIDIGKVSFCAHELLRKIDRARNVFSTRTEWESIQEDIELLLPRNMLSSSTRLGHARNCRVAYNIFSSNEDQILF